MKFANGNEFTHYINRIIELRDQGMITMQEAYNLYYNACETYWNERYGAEKKFAETT